VTAPPPSRAAGPFSSLAVLWMVVVGGVSGVLFLVLTAYAPDLRSASNGGSHALSKSAIGFAALAELLEGEGAPVVISRTLHPDLEGKERLLVLTPGLDSDPHAMAALKASGPELIVLPKWTAIADEDHPGWVSRLDLAPADLIETSVFQAFDHTDHIERRPGRAETILTGAPGSFAAGSKIVAGRIDSLQSIAGPDQDWASVLADGYGDTVLAKLAGKEIYILSDPDLLNNRGLAQLANAREASALIDGLRAGRPVAFDVTLAGFSRTRSLLRLAFEPPFLAATLCALAAAALMGLHAATRFGPPLRLAPAFAFGKRALADNSAALVRLVRREHRMGQGYGALTRTMTARAIGTPRDIDDDQLDALLDRLGRAKGVSAAFSELMREAREAKNVAALMTAAGKLYQWRGEMTRERR